MHFLRSMLFNDRVKRLGGRIGGCGEEVHASALFVEHFQPTHSMPTVNEPEVGKIANVTRLVQNRQQFRIRMFHGFHPARLLRKESWLVRIARGRSEQVAQGVHEPLASQAVEPTQAFA